MLAFLGFVACIALYVLTGYVGVKAYRRRKWHETGEGDRKARAEYAKMLRESPDSTDAKLTEAEFVDNFVNRVPGHAGMSMIFGVLAIISFLTLFYSTGYIAYIL